MSQNLQTQLWNIANTLRGIMGADEFRDYILGFIFYKYLSEKMQAYANKALAPDGIRFGDIDEDCASRNQYLNSIRELALEV